MANSEPTDSGNRARQLRLRVGLVVLFGGLLAGQLALNRYAQGTMAVYEAQVLAGDFPDLVRLDAPLVVEPSGAVNPVKHDELAPSRGVASLRLIPPGKYTAVIIAHDGDPAHLQRSELVVAACDAGGQWHPAEAVRWVGRARPQAPKAVRGQP